jgi:2-phosphosulfolactate phosphatase
MMPISQTVVIDCFPESVERYADGWAVVAIDVIRATTVAITAVASGRRCFPVPTVTAAKRTARRLENPLLAGELGGVRPEGFEMNNSPSEVAARTDVERPLVLVSTAGTQLIENAKACAALYLACFRNHGSVARYLAGYYPRVAVIGAGSRGEFREEDQMCCAWVAQALMEEGYRAQDERTVGIVKRWRGEPPDACTQGNSAAYLRRSGQTNDLEYTLAHVNDLEAAFILRGEEIVMVSSAGYDAILHSWGRAGGARALVA